MAIGGRGRTTEMLSTMVGGVVTSSTSYRGSSGDVVTAVAAAGSILESDAMAASSLMLTNDVSLQAVVAGLSYSHAVRPWLALEVDALGAPIVRVQADSVDHSTAANLGTADWYKRTIVRGVLDVHAGRWMLSGGAIASPGNFVVPWLGFAWSSR
jgi:hypothetical protein